MAICEILRTGSKTVTIALTDNITYGLACIQLSETLREKLQETSISMYVLDCSRAVVVDSAGLGTIVDAYRIAKLNNKTLAIVAPSTNLTKHLKATNVDSIIPIYRTIGELALDYPDFSMIATSKP